MRVFFSILTTVMLIASPSWSWPVKVMNDTINSSNFIVGDGCSGTLISLDHRLILTNYHCVVRNIKTVSKRVTGENGAIEHINVEKLVDLDVAQNAYDGHQLVGRSLYKAELIARSKPTDLALLQIRADIPNGIAVTVSNGDQVTRGELVYVVGNPFGLDATVLKGIVSSTTRTIKVGDSEKAFIQVDAGVMAGNSGGALFNNSGALIGVPAAAIPNNAHVGLAIPLFSVQEFLTDNCWGEVWDDSATDRETCLDLLTEDADK